MNHSSKWAGTIIGKKIISEVEWQHFKFLLDATTDWLTDCCNYSDGVEQSSGEGPLQGRIRRVVVTIPSLFANCCRYLHHKQSIGMLALDCIRRVSQFDLEGALEFISVSHIISPGNCSKLVKLRLVGIRLWLRIAFFVFIFVRVLYIALLQRCQVGSDASPNGCR